MQRRLALTGRMLVGMGILLAMAGLVAGGGADRPASVAAQVSTTTAARATTTTTAATTTTRPADLLDELTAAGAYLALEAAGEKMPVYRDVGVAEPTLTLPRLNQTGQPTVLLATKPGTDPRGARWYQVRLDMRPNGSRGWVRASDTRPVRLTHHIEVSLRDRRLDLYDHDTRVRSFPVAIGQKQYPTPVGDYFMTVKMRPPQPNGPYGELAIAISAYSETLTDWPGGGQVGIHGTNDPSGIGKSISHGCIRMRNEDITALSQLTPLGTPVLIRE